MSIIVVGNILQDVYLNLDARTENFETDKTGTKWLDLSFNASEHHFFSRASSLGGAAISLEVLQKLGLSATISGSQLNFTGTTNTPNDSASAHRYIMVADGQVTYFAPSDFTKTTFTPLPEAPDYLYIDRSAEITINTAADILNFLDKHPNTKLVIYARNFDNAHLNILIPRADLLFSELSDAPELQTFDHHKLIKVSETRLSYLNITEHITAHRVDILTHLSLYSIASATILGCFILGKTVEDSLKLAKLNIENAKLNSVLSLSELNELMTNTHTSKSNPELIAKNLVLYPKGILAADESGGSIHKKFAQLNIPDTYDNRRDYRNLFFTTPHLSNYVNGVILFDETARQAADNGQKFVDYLTAHRIIPGIKVDQGLEHFNPDTNHPEETYTKGLDGLENRLKEYYQMGIRFAKWRAAFTVQLDSDNRIVTPSDFAVNKNCQILAEYAKECQAANIVPIVEPELVYDGNYDINTAANLTGRILDCLFLHLDRQKVNLKACILKVNMVLAGKQYPTQSTPEEVGMKTAEVLKTHIPSELAGIVFLSGGQTPEQATANLTEIIKHGPFNWPITFSFARALQDPALYAWAGNNTNIAQAQKAFTDRLQANTSALKNNP